MMVMRVVELIRALDWLDMAGIWALDGPRLEMLFNESPSALAKSLSRHEEAGVIKRVCKDVYMNPRARSAPTEPLLALVSVIRPFDFSYLSLECVLSEAGWISQVPMRYTVMTTGRSYLMTTPIGILEFTHTVRVPLSTDVVFDPFRGIHVAVPERALRDLRHVGRNLDLVKEESDDGARV